jgi:branched-chain amino acid transport system substrate-binding protein
MKNLKFLILVLLVLTLVPTTMLAACTSATTTASTLKIGAIVGLTGPGSDTYIRGANALGVAADWVNSKGGITVEGEKYLIDLDSQDCQMSMDGVVAAATKLILRDNVKFIIGSVAIPPFKEATSKLCQDNKVLKLDGDGVGTLPELSSKTPYTFATMMCRAGYDFMFRSLVEYYPQIKTVALICAEDPGAIADMDTLEKYANNYGLRVVAKEPFAMTTTDYYPLWTKVLDSNPDSLVTVAVLPSWMGSIMKQGRELGFKGPIGCFAFTEDLYVIRDIAGDFATDFITDTPDLRSPEMTSSIKEISQIIKNELDVELTMDHLISWEALWALTQAIENAQSLDPTQVKNSFEKTTGIDTPYGKGKMGGLQTYGINHVIVRPCALTRIMNGEIKHIKWFTPEVP